MRHPIMDKKIEPVVIEGFSFPLGVYPTEPMEPVAGFTEQFEAADSENDANHTEDDWEVWPDRFVYDVVISSDRLRALCRGLFAILPGRVYPILDVLGSDAFREIDPYLAYDLVGIEKLLDGLQEVGDWLYEDGMVGFGAMSLDPFIYIFIDEHKITTIRVEGSQKDRVEKLLRAFDLRHVDEIHGADSAEHEHRTVLAAKPAATALTSDEIIERLRDQWSMQLNIDASTNLDADDNDLGVTGWQCVARTAMSSDETNSYAEVLLTADSLDTAEQLAIESVQQQAPSDGSWDEIEIIRADRVTPEQFTGWLEGKSNVEQGACAVEDVRWLAGGPKARRGKRQARG